VDNFIALTSSSSVERVTSPTFSNGRVQWRLSLYPNGFHGRGNYVSLKLERMAPNNMKMIVHFKVTVPQKYGDFERKAKNVVLQEPNFRDQMYSNLLIQGFAEKNVLAKCCDGDNDRLTIICDLTFTFLQEMEEEEMSSLPPPAKRLRRDIGSLWESGFLSDVVVKAGNQTFNCHKSILASRSPVFKAMFSHNMLENRNNEVIIKDIQPRVVKGLLEYIYTDNVANMGEFAGELLMASEEYASDALKLECEHHLSSNIAVENAAEVLALAHASMAETLKDNCVKFINLYGKEVMKTNPWLDLCKERPQLVIEVLHARFREDRRQPSDLGWDMSTLHNATHSPAFRDL